MVTRRLMLGVGASAVLWPLPHRPAAASPPDLPKSDAGGLHVWGEIVTDAQGAKRTLSTGPYIADGQGPALYMWTSQFCPRCELFLRNYRPSVSGVQFRYYIAAWPQDSADQIARLMITRSLDDFHQYSEHRLAPGPYSNTVQGQALLKNLAYAKTQLGYMLAENSIFSEIYTPAWFWESGNRLFSSAGYGPRQIMDGIIASVKSSANP
jgi:hypothetical protein